MSSGISGATIDAVSTEPAKTYAVTVNTGTDDGSLSLNLIDNDSIKDMENVPLEGIRTLTGDFTGTESYDIRKSWPWVTISSTALSIVSESPIPVTVQFTETVTGFAADDITVTNAFVQNFTGSGAGYSFDLVPLAEGQVTAYLPSGIALDAESKPNFASNTLTWSFHYPIQCLNNVFAETGFESGEAQTF